MQTDKIKYEITYIQSIDRFALAEKLHPGLLFANNRQEVFDTYNTIYTLKIKGLMTIRLLSTEAEEVSASSCLKRYTPTNHHS